MTVAQDVDGVEEYEDFLEDQFGRSHRLYVTFKNEGNERYGKLPTYEADAVRQFNDGVLLVDDLTLPQYWTIPLDAIDGVEPVDMDEAMEWRDEQYDRAVERAKKQREKGELEGRFFSKRVADGLAYYLVTNVEGDEAEIEWRGLGGGEYVDSFIGHGGTFDIDRVRQHVQQTEKSFD